MEALFQDLRYGLRGLRRSRGFTAVAVATLALGIGATTTIFSVLEGVLLRPLPYPRSERLVQVWERTPEGGDFPASLPNFRDFRSGTRLLTGLAAADERALALTGKGVPERVKAQAVSAEYFRVLGVAPALGGVLTADATRGGEREVVLGHRIWVSRFGGDRGVVGSRVRLNGESYAVVGVMPAGFEAPGDPEAWVPLAGSPEWGRGDHSLMLIGRLAAGASVAGASAELGAVARRLSRLYPESNGGWGVRVAPLLDGVVGAKTRGTLWILTGAVSLLLLLACVNVASLLLGRAAARQGELVLRAALGARRGRIARQLVTESLLLAGLGTAGGVLIAVWGLPVLKRLLPATTPRLGDIHVDGAVLFFSIVVSVAVGLLAGLPPALRVSRPNLRSILGMADRRTTRESHRLRDGLVVAETALATLLLVGAGLLATSFVRLRGGDRGIDTRDVVVVPVSLAGPRYDDGTRWRFLERAEAAIGGLPGVEAVGATNVAPLSGAGTVVDLSVEGQPTGPGLSRFARWRSVTPGYFRAAGVRLLAGRRLRASDYAPDAAEAVVVTRSFARAFFPDVDPVGRRVAMGTSDFHWRTVVGVVEDVQDVDATQRAQPLFYMPETGDWPWMTLVLRTSRPAASIAPEIRSRIWAVDPELPVPTVEAMTERLDRAVAGPRLVLGVMVLFGGLAVLLAAIGIYGVMAHFVALRRREIGVRLALGGPARDVVGLVVRRGGALAGSGVALGLAAALLAGRMLRSELYDTAPTEPAAYAGVLLLLLLVTLAAVAVPAWRSARVDPVEMLRQV